MEEGKLIGKVIHYFGKIGVAIIQLEDILKVGDTIKIVDGKVDVTQSVDSMEVDHKKLNEAKAGELVGLKVIQKVTEEYKVYKL
jgi:putative protease